MDNVQNKKTMSASIIALLIAFMASSCGDSHKREKDDMTTAVNKRVMLVGASVGKSWNLTEYAERMNEPGTAIESVAAYQFDKTEALEEVLMRPKRKFRVTRTYLRGLFGPAPQLPHVIIIKECSAYFPGELQAYQRQTEGWIRRIQEKNIRPVLATVVPVTRERAGQEKGKIEGIQAFNDWLREYAKRENILLLDLEAALRINAGNRYLRDDLTSGDGAHLNQKAYHILDTVLQNALHNNTSLR